MPPSQDLGQAVLSVNSYCTIILEYVVLRDIDIISVKLRCLHLTFSLVTLVGGVGGKLSRLIYLAPRPRFGLGSFICPFLLDHYLGICCCKRYRHYFSQTEMFTSTVQFGYPCWRVGCKLSRLVYLAPRPRFGSGSFICPFLLDHYLGICSCKRYRYYFSQTEMFTSTVQFGYPCRRGLGQAVRAGLSCPPPPPPRIWVRQLHPPILIAPFSWNMWV